MKNRTTILFKLSTVLLGLGIFAVPAFAASLSCTGPQGGPFSCDYSADGGVGQYGIYTSGLTGMYHSASQSDTGVTVGCTGTDWFFFNQPYDFTGQSVSVELGSTCTANNNCAVDEGVGVTLDCTVPTPAAGFAFTGPEVATDAVVAAHGQVVSFFLLVIGALLGLGLIITGIWWGYHKVKSIIRSKRRL